MRHQKQPQCLKITQNIGIFLPWLIVAIIIAITAGLRIRLFDVPLDRDEGGYAYTAQLILDGIPPFARSYDMKMPGLYYVYALFLILFGQTTTGIHLGLLVTNAVTIVLLYLIGKRLFNMASGIIAGAAYAVMSLSQAVQGFSANAEHLLLAPALAGILLLLRGLDCQRAKYLFASGLLVGVAQVIKHQGLFFAGFAAVYLFLCFSKKPKNQWSFYLRQYLLFLLGLVIPFSLLCLYFWAVGLFSKFWFWLFEYTQVYVSRVPFHEGIKYGIDSVAAIAHSAIMLWFLVVIGLIGLVSRKNFRHLILFVALFFLSSLAAIIPGYHFYGHYFVLILPVMALLVSLGVSSIVALLPSDRFGIIKIVASILLTAGAIIYALIAEKAYLFELTPAAISRTEFGLNPFPESVEVADYIKKHSQPNDSIAILGSEPQIFFYADRHSATSYIYMYPLMEPHSYALQMQKEMIQQIEAANPRFLVYVNMPISWLARLTSEKLIFDWFQHFQQRYKQVGVADFTSDNNVVYHWGQDSINYPPLSPVWIAVYQRNN
jgi:hypothetical protein